MMINKTKFREAVKVGLAIAIVYGIAIKMTWINPYWAGWAVIMTSLPSQGQTIQKSLLRILGTVPAAAMALLILYIAPQQRWLFMFIVSAWVFFVSYNIVADKKYSYTWFILGYVSMIVLLTGPSSSENLFMHAVFRVVENVMGIGVYTLVVIFIWPITNTGAIKKASVNLLATQSEIFSLVFSNKTNIEKQQVNELHATEIKQLNKLTAAIGAEWTESYDVQEVRSVWDRFNAGVNSIMILLDRRQTAYAELLHLDINKVLPNHQALNNVVDQRFSDMQKLLKGETISTDYTELSLNIDNNAFTKLSLIDRSGILLVKEELGELDKLTSEAFDCISEIFTYVKTGKKSKSESSFGKKQNSTWLPVLDKDFLRAAIFPVSTFVAMYLLWIYVNPPGGFVGSQVVTALAMSFLTLPVIVRKDLTIAIIVAVLMGILVYVFIMPQLSSYLGLGLLLFATMFIATYFFSGAAVLAGQVAVLTQISISNPQTYSFAASANGFMFLVVVLGVLSILAYILSDARPEKTVGKMTKRFFSSAEYLVSKLGAEPLQKRSLLERWRIDMNRHEMRTLPSKIGAIGAIINTKLFPEDSLQQVKILMVDLQTLVYRIEELFDAKIYEDENLLLEDIKEDVAEWKISIENILGEWSVNPSGEVSEDITNQLEIKLKQIINKVEKLFKDDKGGLITEANGESYYKLVAGLKGINMATAAYAGATTKINWKQWKEEVF